jgi:hypothetical protein
MFLRKIISRLRINSFIIFLIPSIAIIGSLLLHNFLVDFSYYKGDKNRFLSDTPGSSNEVNCTLDNSYCLDKKFELSIFEKNLKLGDCFIYKVDQSFLIDGKAFNIPSEYYLVNQKVKNIFESKYFLGYKFSNLFTVRGVSKDISLRKKYSNSKITFKEIVNSEKEKTCIKNNKNYYFLYKNFFPIEWIFEKTNKMIVKGFKLGAEIEVNPFLYGEVSISNLVKRYPIIYFFKAFLYITSIFMLTYWYNYNQIFKSIINKKNNIFYYFGIGSAILLFLHIFFLGTPSNSEILKDFRRLVILLFIFFEILAQSFLTLKVYKYKNIFKKHINNSIFMSKIIFVSIISLTTIVILLSLVLYDVPKKINYILEWNYFIILLFFYLLSNLLWKKNS